MHCQKFDVILALHTDLHTSSENLLFMHKTLINSFTADGFIRIVLGGSAPETE